MNNKDINIQEYIESGILETYVMGLASESEVKELLYLKKKYPKIQNALQELETDIEYIADRMAITPPTGMWTKISDTIDEIIITPKPESLKLVPDKERPHNADNYKQEKYIEVEAESNYIRVHKTWKWVFAAVFILAKIFLIAAIYFYLENRQAQQQLQELKKELQNIHGNR